MPLNKDAYTRYLLIDQRLNAKGKEKPSLMDLVNFVSDKLGKSISESTIQKDILAMRKDPNLGYEAPIVYDRADRSYRYEYDYSIHQLPVDENDLPGIAMALSILSRYKDLPAIKDMEELLLSLGQKVNVQMDSIQSGGVISFDSNKYLGIEFLSTILDAIQNRKILYIDYQTFNSKEVKEHKVHPYFLKEFDNRIYLIGLDIHREKDPLILTFALDRCVDVVKGIDTYSERIPDRDNFFKHLYGVGMANNAPEKIKLAITPLLKRFLETNPLHFSQKFSKEGDQDYLSLDIVINYEIQSKILGMGSAAEVLEPLSLRNKIQEENEKMLERYKSD